MTIFECKHPWYTLVSDIYHNAQLEYDLEIARTLLHIQIKVQESMFVKSAGEILHYTQISWYF